MKRLLVVLSMMLFLGIGAAQAQTMTVTGDITLAYCSYLEYTFTVTDSPQIIEAVYARFSTDTGQEFYSDAVFVSTQLQTFTSYTYNGPAPLSLVNATQPANTNIRMKLYVNPTGPIDANTQPDFVTNFVPCIGSSLDINVPVELPSPAEDDIFPGYDPTMSGWKAAVYPLGGDDGGFQVIGNFGNFIVTEADLAELPENPEGNILLAGEEGRVTLYYLTTGEFQINLPPDMDGKVISIIFNLETGEFYTREFNIYDVLEGTS